MGQYDRHVFVCTSGETCPTQGDTKKYVKLLRDGARQAGRQADVRVNKSGCFSQCGHGPMVVVYPDDVWYAGVQEAFSKAKRLMRSVFWPSMRMSRVGPSRRGECTSPSL